MTADEPIAQIELDVFGELVAVIDEVIITLILDQLIRVLANAVDIEEIALRSVVRNHLAISIEFIVAREHGIAVGVGMAVDKPLAEIHFAVLCVLVAVADEVVIAFLILNQLVSFHLQTVNVEEVFIRTCQRGSNAVRAAVKILEFRRDIVKNAGEEIHDSGLHVSALVEEIGLSVNLVRFRGIHVERRISVIARSVPVAETSAVSCPDAVGHAALIKDVSNAVFGRVLAVNAGIGVLVKEIPFIVDHLPAVEQLAVCDKVVLAIDHLQTAHFGFLAAMLADEFVAGNHIVVSGRGDRGAPVNDGAAALAEGAAGVAVLGAGGSLVLDGCGIMDVCGSVLREVGGVHVVTGRVHLGRNAELLVGEGAGGAVGKGDEALVDIQLQIVAPELVGRVLPVLRGGLAGDMDIGVIVEDTDGDLRENRFAGLIVVTGTGEGDGGGVGLLVDGVISGEALGKHHVIELPVVDAVHIDDRLNRLDLLDVGGNEVHPVDGAEEDSVERRVGGNQLHGGSAGAGLDLEHTDHDRGVARVIGNLELHAVIAVGNGDVARGHDAVGIGSIHGNTVNIRLGGSGIDAGGVMERNLGFVRIHSNGRVSNIGGEVHNAASGVDDLTLGHSGAVHIELVKHRLFSVVDSLGIVNRNIVDIEGVRSDHGTAVQDRVVLRSGEDERQEELTIFAGSILGELPGILQRDLLILAEIHLHIVPAGLIDALIDLVREGGRHGDEALGVVGAVAVAVGHVVALDPQLDAVIGDVEPEAERTRVFKLDRLAVNAQSDPAVLTGVRQVGGQTVELHAKGMLAVMDLAVRFVGQRERHVIVLDRALAVVDHVPDVNVRLAALEVKEDIGASAEIELEVNGRIGAHIQRGRHIAGQVRRSARLIDSRELQPDEAAERSVVRNERNVVRAEADLMQAVVDRSLDGDVRRLAEGDGDNRLIQRDRIRRGDGDLLFTHDLIVVDHLHGHVALGAVGREDAVFDGTHALFLERPLGVGGNVDLGADRVSAECIKRHGAAGGVVIIVAGDGGVGKHAVSRSVGDDEDGVGGRTLAAVGQGAVDLQILAGTLRAEGGGSAAVAVAGVDAPHTDHVVRHLIHGEASGERSLISVGH